VFALIAPSSAVAAPEASDPGEEPVLDGSDDSIATNLVLIRILPDSPQIRARLQAELGLLGFVSETLELEPDTPALAGDLLDQLEPAGAAAAIEIVISDERIELWVADRDTGKTVTRRLDAQDGDQGDPRTVAIAAVELLRAARVEAKAEVDESDEAGDRQATESERPPEEPVDAPRERPVRGAISLAPVISGSPGGLGPSNHVEIAGRWAPPELPKLGVRACLWVPTLGNRVANNQGSARMFIGMAFVEPQLRLPGGARWLHPELGLGLGAAVTGIVGEAREGSTVVRSNTQILAGFASFAHLGLGFAVTRRLWLRLDGYLGVIQPQPRVIFVDQVAAAWGLPWGSGALGIEIWL
jgi:hypothetical protein